MKNNFILKPEHVELLGALNVYGCLDTQYIYWHFFAAVTLRRCQQVLSQLANEGLTFHAKLLATIVPKNKHAPQTKRVPALNYLAPDGAKVLLSETGMMPFRVLRSRPQPYTLLHRWDQTKTRLALDRSLSEIGQAEPEWILESDLRQDLPDKTPPNKRFVLYHSFGEGGDVFSCIPDAACSFRIGGRQFLIHWEHDRSTESKQQITRKAKGLDALLEQQPFVRYWRTIEQDAKSRVFWTVQSVERIRSICTALKLYPTVLNRSRFIVNPKKDQIGPDGIDKRQLATDRLIHLPDATVTSLS